MRTNEEDLIHSSGDAVDLPRYEMVRIPSGTFTMGCTPEQESICDSDEKPSHKVRISRDYYMGTTEVTQRLYKKVMGKNPTLFTKKTCT